ncbi:nuclear factor 7, ovary-like [Astyanax mexicanus]|uniref:nuclear factor 7, ovary-like n=1 Tax=Astyanax mexicanus TaxID=7994 RepID=UPI0020CB2DA1|nr:nuclear factor 7, ovary-like [Astyanax mexicanus]
MASSQNSLEKNLKCSICSDIFKDPVLLSCSHSFCAACLDKSGNVKPTIECSICKSEVQQTEEQIKEEFEKLHQFLRDEEEARITALKQEEEEKKQKINEKVMEIEKVWSGLSERIKKTEDDMKGDESLFIHNFRDIEERTKFTEPDLELDLGALIDVVKHVGNLKFRVWEKIKDICPYYPVLLVPGSRTSNLQLCKDFISVRANPNTTSQLVSNSLPPAILGSEGFTSGTHSWTVEVGTSDHWAVGITSISGNRLKNPGSKIGLFNGKSTWDSTAPKFTKVRVKLDCENRLVEYTNPDNNTVLQRKNYVIAATMYPYFYTLSQDPLKILPAEVSVTMPID